VYADHENGKRSDQSRNPELSAFQDVDIVKVVFERVEYLSYATPLPVVQIMP
jgi:hypothetical protein